MTRGDYATLRATLPASSGALRAVLTVRKALGGEKLLEKTVSITADQAVFVFERADTAALDPGAYVYDVRVCLSDAPPRWVTPAAPAQLLLRGAVGD